MYNKSVQIRRQVGFLYFILLFIFYLVNISDDEIWETFYMKQQKRICSIRAVALKYLLDSETFEGM